uniref:NBS-LRR type resistance protein n=1 Tax=Beta vulgaris TaxID=161934 RepID=A0FD18_BETVU|nr:NBS-LRR type resistance protein [Beta vulgaris]
MSKKVKNIRKKLDAIASNYNNFGFSVDSQPIIRKRKEDTCSSVYEGKVIGRENDVNRIIGLLLDSNIKENVSFLTIVGMGGLGKTALAQLVFNNARLKEEFSLKLWTDVADHDEEQLDVDGILRGILASAVGKKDQNFVMDVVQNTLREELTKNKYLLVLDDVWTQNRSQWQDLEGYLLGGQKGSRVMVTTRSHDTARIVGGMVHELQGLSKENSWLLFEKIAFEREQSKAHEDLIHIGQKIVEQCRGVPLAIRVAGSLVYGHDKSKWLLFQDIGIFNSKEGQKNIMPILKLSYDQLDSHLKSCFTYCGLFPKDYVIKKELLIGLWMAQGFIFPLEEGQRVEDAAEEHFTILLERCFFQNINYDEFGAIYSCKMHDLMHDMAKTLAGKEICITNSTIMNVDKEVRHLSFTGTANALHAFPETHIRSYLSITEPTGSLRMQQQSLEALVANWLCLKVLDLTASSIKSLPISIGKLLHLRFLDLSYNVYLQVLPESITNLCNLETLKLTNCCKLKELPNNVIKLVELRILDVGGCEDLTHMPRGMSRLNCIHTLGRFVVKSSCWKQIVDELEELKGLKSLKGKLAIDIKANCNNDLKINEWDIREGAYLRNKEHINDVAITFNGTERSEEALRLMEELQPHSNIKRLEICGYVGVGMPSWTRGNNLETFLPNLTALEIFDSRIKYMTCLGNLSHLKSLELSSLEDLEYIIDYGVASIASMTVGLSIIKGPLLFPSLKLLRLMHLPKLKGWRRSRMGVEDDYQLLGHNSSNNEICDFYDNMEPKTLPQLTKLGISECPNLECDFFCPVLEGLTLKNFNKRMQIRSTFSHSKVIGDEKEEVTSGDTLTSSSSSSYIPKRSEIKTDDVEWLINSQPVVEGFRHFQVLFVNEDDQVKILGMMMSKLSALIFLQIEDCPNLISVSVALQHLTSLKELEIKNCPNLNLLEEKREDEVDVDMPWRSLSHSLRRLKLSELPQLVDLPSWMQFLEALETLHIDDCKGLESLPNWMPKLTALRHLRLSRSSPRLKERLVSAPPGEDWPDIQHILSVHYY